MIESIGEWKYFKGSAYSTSNNDWGVHIPHGIMTGGVEILGECKYDTTPVSFIVYVEPTLL